MGWHGSYRLEIGAAGYVIKPDGAERNNGSIGCDGDEVQVSAVERRRLNVAVSLRIISIFSRDVDIVFMKSQP
jgi:hypothetical protein